MGFRGGFLTGAVIILLVVAPLSRAQDNTTFPSGDLGASTTPSTDPVQAAQDAQNQKAIELTNLIANAESQANQQKDPLISQYAALNVALSKCDIDAGNANLTAQQQADQQVQDATQNAVQSGLQGLTPLLQNGLNVAGGGAKQAQDDIDAAVQSQNTIAKKYEVDCKAPVVLINKSGSNAKQAQTSANNAFIQGSFGGHSGSGSTAGASGGGADCSREAAFYKSETDSAAAAIKDAQAEKDKMNQAIGSIALAGITVGADLYGLNQAKKTAAEGLSTAKQINANNLKACKDGIESQAQEIQRQIAAIDAQLADDINRLKSQFAAMRVTLPPNLQNRLDVSQDDAGVQVGQLAGAAVGPTNLGATGDPFANLNKKDTSPGNGNGAGGAAPGAAAGEGKLGWGFKDPMDNGNPGLAYSLPPQPDKASFVGGADGGGGGGGAGENPGDSFLGFGDPFANVNNQQKAEAKSTGNGFWELAMRTHRRLYAHLGELLGKPSLPRTPASKPTPNKITSAGL